MGTVNDDPNARTSNTSARPQQHAGVSLADFYANLAHWCGLEWPRHSMHEAAHEAVEALADAKEEIERLARERDEAREHTSTAAFMRLERERDEWAAKWHRVRAELADLKYPGMKGVVRPLSGESAPKRAYYETHDPPHCPTCGCGSAPETSQKPTDSELYGSSELFRHVWFCPMGWVGDKLIYGPGYTSADMKQWLIGLRRLVGFNTPEGVPLESPPKASGEP